MFSQLFRAVLFHSYSSRISATPSLFFVPLWRAFPLLCLSHHGVSLPLQHSSTPRLSFPLLCPSARFRSTRFLCVASSHPAFPLPLVSIRFHCILRLVLPFRYFSELFHAVPLQIRSYLFLSIALPLLSKLFPCPSDRLGSIALSYRGVQFHCSVLSWCAIP